MFKMSGVKLEKISDIGMHLFIEKDREERFLTLLRDTVKHITNTQQNYDPTKPSNENNLYGQVMSGYLSYAGFKWLKNADNFYVNSISENSPIGYILEVDLEYPG